MIFIISIYLLYFSTCVENICVSFKTLRFDGQYQRVLFYVIQRLDKWLSSRKQCFTIYKEVAKKN